MDGMELVAKINQLSTTDYNMVVMLVDRLIPQGENLVKKDAEGIVNELVGSVSRSDLGHTKPAAEISKQMREKYELQCEGV